jgi:hypothetical protein
LCILSDRGIDWTKSREVYNYCNKQGIDTGVLIPIVSALSNNILLGEKIIGTYRKGEIIIYAEDLLTIITR